MIRLSEITYHDFHINMCFLDSLAKICSSKKNISLSEEIISNWGVQVARGMNYLHSLNVLHRDLKAANGNMVLFY